MRYKSLGLDKKKYPRRSYKWICENVDEDQMNMLLELHLRLEDLCDFFDVSPNGFRSYFKKKYGETFESYSDKRRVKGKITLMQKFWQKVKAGNMTAIIFGLKNIMDWHDNVKADLGEAGFQFREK